MSNQIEMIQKLYAKVQTYKVPKEPREGVDQVSLEITPLSIEDMGLLNMQEGMPLDEIARNVKIMVSRSLGIEEDEAGKISVEFMEDLMEAIMDANNFKEEDMKKTGIKEFIQNKKDQIKDQEKK